MDPGPVSQEILHKPYNMWRVFRRCRWQFGDEMRTNSADRDVRWQLSLIRHLWAADPRLVIAILSLRLVRGSVPGLLVWVTARLIDAIAEGDASRVVPFFLAELFLALLVIVIQQFCSYAELLLGERHCARMSGLVVTAVTNLQLLEIESDSGQDRIERAQRACSRNSLVPIVFNGLQTVVVVIGIWSAALLLSPSVALLVVVGSTSAGMLQLRTARWGYDVHASVAPLKRRLDYWKRVASLPDVAKDIRVYHLHHYIAAQYQKTADAIINAVAQLAARTSAAVGASSVATALLFYGAAGVFAFRAFRGEITIGQFVACLGAFRTSQDAIGNGMLFARDLKEQGLVIKDHDELIGRAGNRMHARCDDHVSEIEFTDVAFRYPNAKNDVLCGISIKVRTGSRIALVGMNGSGKSTLIKLLTGLYLPTNGHVCADGKAADANILRSNVAAVFQDGLRLESTIGENIHFGQGRDEDVYARLPRWIQSQAGEEPIEPGTIVGTLFSGARQLSGGQWQAVAIARALQKGAPFLICDEPNSSLDTCSEAQLVSAAIS